MPYLSEDERDEILRVARESIEEAVLHGRLLTTYPQSGIFQRHCGVFVTLHIAGKLRGCIGVIDPQEELGKSLVRTAASAALEDPRFVGIQGNEVNQLEVEVSLLSELQPTAPEEVVVGRDGLLIGRGPRRGLLLPQVATEHHLDRLRFLQETCLKAGLPRDAWKEPGTTIQRFTCEVFSNATKAS
jgi:AmmeMemoRadiSam system protein A